MNPVDQVTLLTHDPKWSEAFDAEAKALRAALASIVVSVTHIGSTAVPGLVAKPIIDIALEVHSLEDLDASNAEMIGLGYTPKGEYGIVGRRYFRKSANGVRTHHVHAFVQNDIGVVRHVALRDYLIAHPERAAAYGDLKRTLVDAQGATRATYVYGKNVFVREAETAAMRWRNATT